MKLSGLILGYIGTPDSYFTKKFLPALQQIESAELKFICVKQTALELKPEKASLILKFILWTKHLKYFISEFSSTAYWSIYCQQHHFQFIKTKEINSEECKSALQHCDFVLSAGIRNKFISEILTTPKNGIINFHYSLLPKYRGTHPVFWQKVNRDFDFGYTFHVMDEQIDHGNILLQNHVAIEPATATSKICDILTNHASNQLIQLVNNPRKEKPQEDISATTFTNAEFLNYINIKTSDHGSIWFEKLAYTPLFILNDRWIVHLEQTGKINSPNKFLVNGSIIKDGYSFKFKKINYLPPVFYYFALRNYFE